MTDADLIKRLPLMPREHLERDLEWAIRQRDEGDHPPTSDWTRAWNDFSRNIDDLLTGKKDVMSHLPHKETTT